MRKKDNGTSFELNIEATRDDTSLPSETVNPDDTKEDSIAAKMDCDVSTVHDIDEGYLKRKRIRRSIEVAFVFLITAFFAVCAGGIMAMWDLQKTPNDMLWLINGTYVSAKVEAAYKGDVITRPVDYVADTDLLEQADVKEDIPDDSEGDTYIDADRKNEDSIEDIDTSQEDLTVMNLNDDLNKAGDSGIVVSNNVASPTGNGTYTHVDLDYFDDALFIGDSRMEGFGMYSKLHGTFYAATGFQLYKYDTFKAAMTEEGRVPIFDAIPYDAFTKIYIKVGLNEMGGVSDELFFSKYAELIMRLREAEPRAIIFVHGLLPVTAEKSEEDATHSNPNIYSRNEKLKDFAKSQNAYYVDIASAFALEDGSLPAEMTADGIHLKAPYIDIWKDYLCNNAIRVY